MKRFLFSVGIIFLGIFVSFWIIVDAQVSTIVFPVKELGNCTNQETCKTYCNQPDHITECTAFGTEHNLISKDDAERAREFADVLKGEGPGQCRNKVDCEVYCNDIAHADECIAFAEKHNFIKLEDLAQAKQVAKALKEGGTLPGQCKDKSSCEQYCADTAHVDECLAFGEKAGFFSKEEIEQAKKVLPYITRGESPGKCKTKAECELYCEADTHFNECISFAEKTGIVSAEEIEMAKKTGGKGPGGCRSKESCDAYCNTPENQGVCFAFAKEHNIIPEEKLKEIEEGMGRLRSGIRQMPEEMVGCLKNNLGDDVVQKIEGGTLVPGPLLGDQVKKCVDAFLPKIKQKINEGLKIATPETIQCLEQGLGGSDKLNAIKNGDAPTPEMGDVMKNCFSKMKEEGIKKMRDALETMPPEMMGCVEEKIGKETIEKIKRGEDVEIGPEIAGVFEGCAGVMQGMMQQKMQEGLNQVPQEMRGIIEEKIGSSGIQEKIRQGEIRSPEEAKKLIEEEMRGVIPQNIPSGMVSPQGIPMGTPQGALSEDMCRNFMMAPSCEMVPAAVKDLCKKCKGE
ncbi:MAG: hypothetical protein AB1333_02855 [Patescibacteria group bacterium]